MKQKTFNIQLAKSEEDFEKINTFFGDMWKKEFNLERYDRVEEYKNGVVFFIQEKGRIISAISSSIFEGEQIIGRFGTLENIRGKGYGKAVFSKIIVYLQEKGVKKLYIFAEITRVKMYEHFGFEKISEPKKIGNTEFIKMVKML